MAPDPSRLTAAEAIRAFDSDSLSVEEYALSLLVRIERRDATVKAWAYLDREQVLAQAKALDQVPKGKRGPLHGVAVGIKDVIYTKGMPTQHNSPIYAGDQPEVDAASVIMLRQAGALIMGKTRTTEFAAITRGPETTNPHKPSRTPGGSSSGSGAAVADFQVPLALGTQTGGSTIRPGSFNGVYAFKPTWNAISREGQKIYSLTLDTLGVYGRSIEDIELLCRVFGLQDDRPPHPPTNGVADLKFATLKTMAWDKVGSGTATAMTDGAELLRKHGADVEEISFPPEFDKLLKWHTCVLFSEGRSAFRPEYMLAKGDLDASLIKHVEGGHGFTKNDYLEAFDGLAALRPKWDAIAEKYAAVIVPSVPDEAPSGLESTGSAVFNSMWTALHVPVINVPGFKGENNMPIGLSLVTPRYRDQALVAVAREVGRIWTSKGGWTSEL